MKHRLMAAAGLAAVLLGAAACGNGSGAAGSTGKIDTKGDKNATGTLTVWLQVDAQSSWPNAVKAATTSFHKKFPKVKVKVSYQAWNDHLTKLDAALTGKHVPDVVEMGDTETTSYLANGAFRDLTDSKNLFADSANWNSGLAASCTYEGKVYCVPYYSGSRIVFYRKDMFAKAGISTPPKTLAELMTDGGKLNKKYGSDPKFSAFYMPGKFWYSAMSFVRDAGGTIATKKGDKWVGGLDSPAAIKGLTQWKALSDQLSKASKTSDEANPQQYTVMAQGHVAMMYGLGWEGGSVYADGNGGNPKLKDSIGSFAMPSGSGKEAMQSFAGGSDLAITAKSQHPDWAAAWTAAMTSQSNEKLLMKAGNVPNTTTLLEQAKSDPALSAAASSATDSWMVPISTGWPKVEKSSILQNGLSAIATGKKSVADACKEMNQQVEQALNGS
ncbi:extracellular solute-binding protein [Actinocatenispora comari]|uniref:Sugar ABC transporter substrate-binding protein n=1 Tax=Actinocatenispora comari TaxID=2807577 RepID=A0A8J4ELM2_9ACTN|nr:extracellular solute-binding protein [Actinocatenispora comari]GIL28315.1 sugar ABC transporter substrate-binding protein [Actinocatenispora comari]